MGSVHRLTTGTRQAYAVVDADSFPAVACKRRHRRLAGNPAQGRSTRQAAPDSVGARGACRPIGRRAKTS